METFKVITEIQCEFELTLSSSSTGHSKFSSYSSTNPFSLAIFDTSCHFMEHCLAISAQILDFPTPGVPAKKNRKIRSNLLELRVEIDNLCVFKAKPHRSQEYLVM